MQHVFCFSSLTLSLSPPCLSLSRSLYLFSPLLSPPPPPPAPSPLCLSLFFFCIPCDKGTRYIHSQSFVSKANGDRPKVANILIVITDGQSVDRQAALQQATKLHNLGVNVLAVGVGDCVDQVELAGIASSLQNVYIVSSFDALTTLQDSLQRTACAATALPPGEWCQSFCSLLMEKGASNHTHAHPYTHPPTLSVSLSLSHTHTHSLMLTAHTLTCLCECVSACDICKPTDWLEHADTCVMHTILSFNFNQKPLKPYRTLCRSAVNWIVTGSWDADRSAWRWVRSKAVGMHAIDQWLLRPRHWILKKNKQKPVV